VTNRKDAVAATRWQEHAGAGVEELLSSQDNGATPVEIVLIGVAGRLTAGIAIVAANGGVTLRSVKAIVPNPRSDRRHSTP
jgi:uncharacterized OsmC-like protein